MSTLIFETVSQWSRAHQVSEAGRLVSPGTKPSYASTDLKCVPLCLPYFI